MLNWLFVLTLLAALGSGMMAGLFFAFSTFVMQALAKLSAPAGMAAMQSINETILKPIFFLVFFGTALPCLALIVLAGGDAASYWRYAGSSLYFIGSIAITMVFNVPLNNRLAKVAPDSADGAAYWSLYLRVWTRWNHLRTIACIGATASFILGMP